MSELVARLDDRDALARHIIERGVTAADLSPRREPPAPARAAMAARRLQLPFPEGTQPVPTELEREPSATARLPRADVLVFTWTVDEQQALCDVLTPGVARNRWYRYARGYNALKDS